MKKKFDGSRRSFIQRGAQISLSTAMAPAGLNLLQINEAAAQTATADYKALVCIQLAGGNDGFNMIIPCDDYVGVDKLGYEFYKSRRGDLALKKEQLKDTILTAPGFNENIYAMHPNMTGVASLFNSGKVAVLFNVGPVTPDGNLPERPGSHIDQQNYWQAFDYSGAASVGWGGSMLNTLANQASFASIEINGNNVFMDRGVSYSTTRIQSLSGLNWMQENYVNSNFLIPYCREHSGLHIALKNLWDPKNTKHLLEIEHKRTMSNALNIHNTLPPILNGSDIDFPKSNPDEPLVLHDQLAMVGKLIKNRAIYGGGLTRQIYMVTLPGFDTHGLQLNEQGSLLKDLNSALSMFYAGLVKNGLQDQVTTFTISEFGRTLDSNGDGSDHGWGSHHLIMGGAVNRGLYGGFYGLDNNKRLWRDWWLNNGWDQGRGRMRPTTAVQQYGATLARWFGITDETTLNGIFPGLKDFDTTKFPRNLGFLK